MQKNKLVATKQTFIKNIKKDIKAYYLQLNKTFATKKNINSYHKKQMQKILLEIITFAYQKFSYHNTCILSMGSFARDEICAFSDIDLMFIYQDDETYIFEYIIRLFWDCGIKLSHRVHNINDLKKENITNLSIKTAMIEAKFLYGDVFFFKQIQNKLIDIQNYNKKEYLQQRLNEYYNKNQYIFLRVNLKESSGGLRDANVLFWISKVTLQIDQFSQLNLYLKNDYKKLINALNFIKKVRFALHLHVNKKYDTLEFEFINDISQKLGFESKNAQMQFAKKVQKSLSVIKNICELYILKFTKSYIYNVKNISKLKNTYIQNGIFYYNNYLLCSFNDKKYSLQDTIKVFFKIKDEPFKFNARMIKYLSNCTMNDEDIFALITRLFRKHYLSYYIDLFEKSNTLKYLFKPLLHILNLPQLDTYHDKNVFFHTIKCLQNLENIQDVYVQSLYDDLCADGRYLMRLVLLFHDSGKGKNQNHCEVGAKMFNKFAKKLSLKPKMCIIGSRLIRHHTLLNTVACTQDIYNEKVIFSFLSKIKDMQTLRALYILTYCDVKSVNQNLYSSSKSRLIRQFYDICLDALNQNSLLNEVQKRRKREKALLNNLSFKALSIQKQNQILNISSNLFFLKFTSNQILKIANEAFNSDKLFLHVDTNINLSITFIRKNNINITYILEKLSYLNVVEMEIFDLFDEYKYFKIYFDKNIDKNDIVYLKKLFNDALHTKLSKPKIKPAIKYEDIFIDLDHSQSYILMNLNTNDQKGLLAFVMYVFEIFSFKISTAKIQTIKNKTKNMFLIEKQGILCDNKDKIIDLLLGNEKGTNACAE